MLDTAGRIMPAVTDHHNTSFFRLTAELSRPLDRALLQKALDRLALRCGLFYVCLATTWSGWTLRPLSRAPRVENDASAPCKGTDIHRPGTPLVRFRVRNAVLALEMSHVVTDGFGALMLLKAVLAEYLILVNPDEAMARDHERRTWQIPHPGETVPLEELSDAYQRYYEPGLRWPEPLPNAWRIPGERLPGDEYRATARSVALNSVQARAKALGLSLTEYLASIHLSVLQEFRGSLGTEPPPIARLPVTLMIPADLRRIFPTRSLRNFSALMLPVVPAQAAGLTFGQLASQVQRAIRAQKRPEELSRQITRNVSGTRNVILRVLPRFAIKRLLRVFYRVFGEGAITSHLSNLGVVELPPLVAQEVRSLTFLPGASTHTGTNVGVVSYMGRLYVSFGSVLASEQIEAAFLDKLDAEGLDPQPATV